MEGTVTWALDQLVSDRSFVRAGYGLDQSADWSLTEAYVYDLWDTQAHSHESASLSAAQAEQLWQAVLTDFDAGTIGTRYLFEDQDRLENTCEADLDFSFYLTEQDSMVHRGGSVTITLTPRPPTPWPFWRSWAFSPTPASPAPMPKPIAGTP